MDHVNGVICEQSCMIMQYAVYIKLYCMISRWSIGQWQAVKQDHVFVIRPIALTATLL